MLLDFVFGFSFILLMAIMLTVVMLLSPKWGFAFTGKEVKRMMADYPEAPIWKRLICLFAILLLVAVFLVMIIYAVENGLRNDFPLWRLWLRFMIIFYMEKAYDLFVLDFLWVKKSGWFQKKFPALRECEELNHFKVFRREQVVRLVCYPFISFAIAGFFFIFK